MLRFRHEIARLAAEQAIRSHRRGAIHIRVLQASTLGYGGEDRLASALRRLASGEAVLRYATRAACRAAGLASQQEAAAQFERALRFADGAESGDGGLAV